ncbi:hypothetical protein LCGC14_0549230 [marine sediment metagenome]|uniref:Uncharacterized protein n=1 Tax=marine sediment metagenome TaxID=412755 RepID=A0A0F9RVA8_9ZZZZ
MRLTEHDMQACSGSLHPQGHTQDHVGPFNLRIGSTAQSPIVERWKAKHVLLSIEQPNESLNFTLVHLLFLRKGTPKPSFTYGYKFHNAKVYRRKSGEIEVRIKKRYSDSFPHPFPLGKYLGTCWCDLTAQGLPAGCRFAFYSFQASSHRKQPEVQKPKTIITPGDIEYGLTLAHAKKTFRGTDGMAG